MLFIFLALELYFAELELFSCNTSGLHGLSHLRRSESATAEIQHQTGQVRLSDSHVT